MKIELIKKYDTGGIVTILYYENGRLEKSWPEWDEGKAMQHFILVKQKLQEVLPKPPEVIAIFQTENTLP